MDKTEKSYFEQRIFNELAISEKQNRIELILQEGKRVTLPVFSEDQDGNIRILIYTLNRKLIEFDHPKATPHKPNINNDRIQTYYITRYKPENIIADAKYRIPKGVGTYPFIPPQLIEKYENQTKIKTLVITEGAFKAFKGAIHGLDIIGLSSITHYREKKSKELHNDIIQIIKRCKVKNIIILYDGDCRNLSIKALHKGEDLYKRTASFYYSATNINDLLKDYDVSVYFSHINSEILENNPKGLDDLLVSSKGKEERIKKDLLSISKSGYYFTKINISASAKKLQKYLNIHSPESFYFFHEDKINDKEFVFLGTRYIYDSEKNELKIVFPAEANNYFRVGNYYYEKFLKPNKFGHLDEVIETRHKSIIIEDYGRDFIKYIPKYKTFINIPEHINYQQVINGCYNSYAPFKHSSKEGSCETTLSFVRHIFEEHYELGLDYIQLLYQKPTQKLPILCLVSPENKTGKSTFAAWLREIFINNVSIIGNSEISSDFNAHIASKLVVAIDESFIEKAATIEKVKFLSTTDTLPLNSKGKDIVEISSFLKIILISNNVDKFITATENDERYWVRRVQKPKYQVPDILPNLVEEIPAFLNFLEKRKLSTKNEDRAWFRFDLIKTNAFQEVINASKPKTVREIERRIKEMFLEFNQRQILLRIEDIKELFFKDNYRVDTSTIAYSIKKYFPFLKKYRNDKGREVSKRYKIPYWENTGYEQHIEIKYMKKVGRPYVFNAEDFLADEEWEIFEK